MDNVTDIYPTAPIQQRMLDAQAKQPAQGLYEVEMFHEILTIPKNTAVNIDQLRAAWHKVVAHHSILRTVFRPST